MSLKLILAVGKIKEMQTVVVKKVQMILDLEILKILGKINKTSNKILEISVILMQEMPLDSVVKNRNP